MECPVCGATENIVYNGNRELNGKQTKGVKKKRYKCNECGRTFYNNSKSFQFKYRRDIRIKLLAIILKHSNIAIYKLNKFFGYNEKGSEISRWEKEIINYDIFKDYFNEDIHIKCFPSEKSYSYESDIYESNSKNDFIKYLNYFSNKKGVFISFNDDYKITDICLFEDKEN